MENMTLDQAKQIAGLFRSIGGFTSVEIRQPGGDMAGPDSPWSVELWSVNSRAGNRNLTMVRDAAEVPDMTAAKRIARVAKGKATERDRAALARIAAEKEEERDNR